MSLSPRQKLKILDGVCALHDTFTRLANSDTGIFPYGDDTGRADSSGQVAATSYRGEMDIAQEKELLENRLADLRRQRGFALLHGRKWNDDEIIAEQNRLDALSDMDKAK